MRQLFKVVYTIIGILLTIFIVVKVVNSLKSTKPLIPNDATTELEQYTSQLKGLQTQMKADVDAADTPSPICIINNDPKTGYPYQKDQIQGVFDKVKGDNLVAMASKDAVDAYNAISSSIKAFTDKVDKLLPCSQYCYQGTFDMSLSCECSEPYPVPIIYKDSNGQERVYCFSDDCELTPHKQFIPGPTRDPSKNQCNCLPGFSEDLNGNCVSKTDQELINLTATMKTDTTNLGFFFCKVSDGDNIVTDLNNLKDKADGLIKDGNISQNTMNNYDTAQKAANDAITKYNALQQNCKDYCGNTAQYDEKSNTCICNDPNSTFDKVNGCTCKSGYEPGLNACVPVNNPDTESLIKNTASILQFTNDIINKCTKCITTKTFDDKITLINGLKIFCENIINTGIPSKTSIDAYNTQMTNTNNIINPIKNLPDCGDYCWQATYNETNNDCECAAGTTLDINPADGKPYCYNCGPNSSFVFPSQPNRDSSLNKCVCKPNFGICNTPNLCEDCTSKLVTENTLLNTDYDNIQATVTNNVKLYGTNKIGGFLYNIIPRSNIQSSDTKKIITANNLPDCALYSEKEDAFSFLPGSLSNNCILYTSSKKTNTIPDETSTYGYKL